MDFELISRAERAALGAMIASPGTTARLAHLRTADFGVEAHRAVHRAVMAARLATAHDEVGWREAILRAGGPQVTKEILNDLQRTCPVPAHGGTYAWLVVQGWALRRMEALARETAARSEQAAGEARRLRLAEAPESGSASQAARHITQVAQALRRQAAGISPPQVHPIAVRHSGLSADQERLEEIVLAAVAGPWPHRSRQIAELLAPQAFRDYYRRAVYQMACEMHQADRHVDELTLDWQLAMVGLPLCYDPGGESIGERLARSVTGDEEPG